MAAKIHLEIVTPEGVKFADDVDEFTAPSVEGEFGVLPSHRPFLAGLKTGILRYQRDGETVAVAVGPGFAKVENDSARVITERFMEKSAVDPVLARKDFKDTQKSIDRLDAGATDAEKGELVRASRWAAACLELYGDPPPATVVMAMEIRLLASEDYTTASSLSSSAQEDES